MSQTLTGLLEGLGEKQIADRLAISRHTVHTYVKQVYDRFHVNSRAELLALWIAGGREVGDVQSLRSGAMRDLTIAHLRAERARLSLALSRLDQEIAQRQEQMSQLKESDRVRDA
jgi:ATP/maltotriose-dependent transcriptional regulator MalT